MKSQTAASLTPQTEVEKHTAAIASAQKVVDDLKAKLQAEQEAKNAIQYPLDTMRRTAEELRGQIEQASRNRLVFEKNTADWKQHSRAAFLASNGAAYYFSMASGREDFTLAERGLAEIDKLIDSLATELARTEAEAAAYAKQHGFD